MSSKLNHIKGALASVFLWNSSFRSKCWVHCSFTAETVNSSFPIFLESASSIHSHGLFLWGCHFAERVSACRRERERECLPWCRPAFPGPAIVSSSSPATLSPSLYLSLYMFVCIYISFLLNNCFSVLLPAGVAGDVFLLFCSSLCSPLSSWLKFSL